jgi:hypothetical protein
MIAEPRFTETRDELRVRCGTELTARQVLVLVVGLVVIPLIVAVATRGWQVINGRTIWNVLPSVACCALLIALRIVYRPTVIVGPRGIDVRPSLISLGPLEWAEVREIQVDGNGLRIELRNVVDVVSRLPNWKKSLLRLDDPKHVESLLSFSRKWLGLQGPERVAAWAGRYWSSTGPSRGEEGST